MKIAVPCRAFTRNPTLVAELQERHPDCWFNTPGDALKGQALIDFVRDAEGVIAGLEPYNRSFLEACPRLKVIAKFGVGLENIDLDACRDHGVQIGWQPGVNRQAVAELALGMALNLLRNISLTSNRLKAGDWHKQGGRGLGQCTVGIVGLSAIGGELARLIRPFGCKIIACDVIDRSKLAAELGVEMRSYAELLAESDVVSLHVPLTPSTKHMLAADQIATMRSDAIVINTSRGDVWDFEAVKQALREGRLGGVGADVYPVEPPPHEDLADLENIITTPHIAGNSLEGVFAMGRAAIAGLDKPNKELTA